MFLQLRLSVLGLLCVSLLFNPTAGGNNCPGADEPPKIVPGAPQVMQSSFRSHYSELGLSQVGNQWSLDCKAPYPVEWTFNGNEATWAKIKTKLVSKSPVDSSSNCYTVTLNPITPVWPIFSNVNHYVVTGKTGNYTCRSVADKSKSTSMYKFVYDEKVGTIFSSKSKLNTTVKRTKSGDYIIPCPSNVEDFHASLVKLDEKGLEANVSTSADAIDYDPKIGFLMKKYIAGTGHFKCHGRYKGKSEVLINFKEEPSFAVDPPEENVSFKDNKLVLTCASNDAIAFDTSKLPSEGVEFQKSGYLRNTKSKFTYVSKLTLKLTGNDTIGEVSCVPNSNNKLRNTQPLHTWKFYTAKDCNCAWDIVPRDWENYNRAIRYSNEDMKFLYFVTVKGQYGRFHCNNSFGLDTKTVFLPCKNPMECNIMSLAMAEDNFHHFEKGGTDDLTGATVILSEMTSGYLRCALDEFSNVQRVYAGLSSMYFTDNIPTEDQMRIKSAEDRIFLGDTMLFTCEAVGYLFTHDLKWAYGYRNGSINFLESKLQNDSMGQDKLKIYRASYLSINDRDIQTLYCFAPMLNSTEWRNVSLSLQIQGFEPSEDISPSQRKSNIRNLKSEIVMYRFGDASSKKVRVPHVVTDSTVIIREPIKYIRLDCSSRFPVEWFFENQVVVNSTFKFIRESGLMKNSGKSSTLSFQSSIQVLTNVTETTGNYSCRKMHQNNERVMSSVYIFSSGDESMPIIGHGQHQNVGIKPSEHWVTLPCRVSAPNINVHLYQQQDSGEYSQVIDAQAVRYDPKRGFLIKRSSSLLEKFPQFFACATNANETGHGLSFSLLPEEWEEEAFYQQSAGNGGLYVVIVLFTIIIAALSLGTVHFWRRTKLQEQLIQSYTASKILSSDRQPVVLMDELGRGRENLEFSNELHMHGRAYDVL